jgi:uncharacterized protein YozE (UPF0346 family)
VIAIQWKPTNAGKPLEAECAVEHLMQQKKKGLYYRVFYHYFITTIKEQSEEERLSEFEAEKSVSRRFPTTRNAFSSIKRYLYLCRATQFRFLLDLKP